MKATSPHGPAAAAAPVGGAGVGDAGLAELFEVEGVPVDDGEPTSAGVAEPAGVDWALWLGGLWLTGSALVLALSLVRIVRFDRLLRVSSVPASEGLQRQAEILGRRLGLARVPVVRMTEARISPMVWWAFGSCAIYVPQGLPEELGSSKTRWILAHELAHVRRRDHLVRWLEWLACVAFWWNPITWWARRNLRVHEELCCDALVMRALRPKPEIYATSLLGVLEFLSASVLRPPALASEARGGFLERRFHMILNSQNARPVRRLHALAVVAAAVFLPLGIAYAQDPDYDAVARRLVAAVRSGEVSVQQAESMMGELAKARFREHLGGTPFGLKDLSTVEFRDTDGDGIPDRRLPRPTKVTTKAKAAGDLARRVRQLESREREVEAKVRAVEAERLERNLRDLEVERRRRARIKLDGSAFDTQKRVAPRGVEEVRSERASREEMVKAEAALQREFRRAIDKARSSGGAEAEEARATMQELRRRMAELREARGEKPRVRAVRTDRRRTSVQTSTPFSELSKDKQELLKRVAEEQRAAASQEKRRATESAERRAKRAAESEERRSAATRSSMVASFSAAIVWTAISAAAAGAGARVGVFCAAAPSPSSASVGMRRR